MLLFREVLTILAYILLPAQYFHTYVIILNIYEVYGSLVVMRFVIFKFFKILKREPLNLLYTQFLN